MTENVAILTWLNRTFPEAELLPRTSNELEAVRQTADLAFFSGTVHPLVTRFARPGKFVADDQASSQVRSVAIQAAHPFWSMIDDRLSQVPWWYGDTWSVVDGYLFWAWWRVVASGFVGEQYQSICAHADRMESRPCVARALDREAVHVAQLTSEGLHQAPG